MTNLRYGNLFNVFQVAEGCAKGFIPNFPGPSSGREAFLSDENTVRR